MDEIASLFKNKRNLINLLFMGILLLALPLGVNLVRNQQILRSQAAIDNITFDGPTVGDLPGNQGKFFRLDSQNRAVVSLTLTAPILTSQVASSKSQQMSFVKTAYAASCSGSISRICGANGEPGNKIVLSWNISPGSDCRAIIESSTGEHIVSHNCSASNFQVGNNQYGLGRITNDGSYRFFLRNGDADQCDIEPTHGGDIVLDCKPDCNATRVCSGGCDTGSKECGNAGGTQQGCQFTTRTGATTPSDCNKVDTTGGTCTQNLGTCPGGSSQRCTNNQCVDIVVPHFTCSGNQCVSDPGGEFTTSNCNSTCRAQQCSTVGQSAQQCDGGAGTTYFLPANQQVDGCAGPTGMFNFKSQATWNSGSSVGRPEEGCNVTNDCPANINSTQVKFRNADGTGSWTQPKTIRKGDSVMVGAFHNGTNSLANDVVISWAGPEGTTGTINIDSGSHTGVFTPATDVQSGTYQITGETSGKTGSRCTASATLTVNDQANNCPTGVTTQARARKGNGNWSTNLNNGVNVGDSVSVAGFHSNQTTTVASDVELTITGPAGATSQTITLTPDSGTHIATFTPSEAGDYTLNAQVTGQSGQGCLGTANIRVGQVAVTVTRALVSNDPNFAAAGTQTLTFPTDGSPLVVPNWTFSDTSVGVKTVYVKFQKSDNTFVRNGNSDVFHESIELVADPVLTSCIVEPQPGNQVKLTLRGRNFGSNRGTVTSNGNQLQGSSWKNDEAKVTISNAEPGASIPIILTNAHNGLPSSEVNCSAVLPLTVNATLACRPEGKLNQENIKVTFKQANSATPVSPTTVRTDQSGLIQGFTPTLVQGQDYIFSIKSPAGIKKTIRLTGQVGTTLADIKIPVGDINNDGVINGADREELKKQWSLVKTTITRVGDFNQDGVVNSIDWVCMRKSFNLRDEETPATTTPATSPSPSPSTSPSPSVSPSP